MSLTKDVKADIRAAKKVRLSWRGILSVMFGSLAICWLFDRFGRFDLALPAEMSLVVLAFPIFIMRDLRHHAWFWGTMTIIAALHVALLLLVPWTTRWVPAGTIAGIVTVDIVVIFAVISLVGKLVGKRHSAE